MEEQCPLYPQKRTFGGAAAMSIKVELSHAACAGFPYVSVRQ